LRDVAAVEGKVCEAGAFHAIIIDRIANACTVSGDSFNRPSCGAVQYRER
jgi:hypothetical protein